jgi:hypothetical protein
MGRACLPPACGPAAVESPDQGDDGAPGRVQCEHHGDTPAVKVENMADDGIQREVEGGDHRLLLRLDHRGQQPPLDPAPGTAAAARTCRAVSSSAYASHRRACTQDGGGGGTPDPSEVHPLATEAASSPRPGRNQDIATSFLSIAVVATTLAAAPSRPHGRVARRRANDWPVGLSSGRCEPRPARTRLGGPRAPCRHTNCNQDSG